MNFGVFLNQYFTPDGTFQASDLLGQAEVIEAGGFDTITLGERHVHEEGVVEPLTTLGALTSRTESLQLGTTALLPALYEPLHLAEQIAMLDDLSDGRMAFGAVIGYRERELEPFDVSLDDRVPRFLEALHVLKRLWREESVTHDGEYWTYDDVFVRPRPRPSMPIWIGGHADIAIKRAAYRGDAWIASPSATPADLERQIDVYERALDEFEADRADNDVILMRDCFVADSTAAAREAIEPSLLTLYRWYARWSQTYLDTHEVAVDWDELSEKFVIGSPEECIERLRTYEALGVDQVLLRCQFPGQPQEPTIECLERLGREVIPAFR